MASRSGRLTIGLVAGLVAVLVLGGVGAVAIARHERSAGGTAAPTPSTTPVASSGPVVPSGSTVAQSTTSIVRSVTSSGLSSTGTTVLSPASSPVTSSSPAGSDPSTAPTGPSNNLTVQMSPSTRTHPRAQEVQQVLQSYFDAINQHDYVSWTQSVTRTLASRQTSQQWLMAYATTVDSSIWMQSMRDDPLQVQIRFTSQQDPDLGPADMKVGCIHWTLTYQVAEQDGQLAIGSTVDGGVHYAKC